MEFDYTQNLIRRSRLIMPANERKYVEKAHLRNADAVVLDLEDSVPVSEKVATRAVLKDSILLAGKGGSDRDGKRDVVTADGGADTASVLLGTGDGRLAAAAHYAAGASPAAVAVADLNGDGSPDAVTADRAADTASVLLGAGDGTLAGAVPYAAGASPAAVAVADLNGDGHRDVVVVGDGNDGVRCCSGTATARSTPRSATHTASRPLPWPSRTWTATACSTSCAD